MKRLPLIKVLGALAFLLNSVVAQGSEPIAIKAYATPLKVFDGGKVSKQNLYVKVTNIGTGPVTLPTAGIGPWIARDVVHREAYVSLKPLIEATEDHKPYVYSRCFFQPVDLAPGESALLSFPIETGEELAVIKVYYEIPNYVARRYQFKACKVATVATGKVVTTVKRFEDE